MRYHNLVYCKHRLEDRRAYLYDAPLDLDVNNGDRLCVQDQRGEHIVTATSPNFFASERLTRELCVNNGGYYPPAKVVGTVRTVTITQDMVEKFADYREEEFPWD